MCVFQGGPGAPGAKGESGDTGPQVTMSLFNNSFNPNCNPYICNP